MTMQVISAVAEFERDLLLERTHCGIAREFNTTRQTILRVKAASSVG
jgi:hypothetical protein